MKFPLLLIFAFLPALQNDLLPAAGTNSFPVAIQVHAGQPKGDRTPVWRSFGINESDCTCMKGGKKFHDEPGIAENGDLQWQ